jgi:hypothetical protein
MPNLRPQAECRARGAKPKIHLNIQARRRKRRRGSACHKSGSWATGHFRPVSPACRIMRKAGKPVSAEKPTPGALVDLNGTGHYLNWGVLHVSAANLVVIAVIVVLFVVALVLPFPKGRGR